MHNIWIVCLQTITVMDFTQCIIQAVYVINCIEVLVSNFNSGRMLEINMSLYCQRLHSIICIGFIHSDCCIVCCHLPDTRKPCIENRSV